MAEETANYVLRARIEGKDFFLKEFDPWFWLGDTPTEDAVLTQQKDDAARFSAVKAKAAQKRADKTYSRIEPSGTRYKHLSLEIVT